MNITNRIDIFIFCLPETGYSEFFCFSLNLLMSDEMTLLTSDKVMHLLVLPCSVSVVPEELEYVDVLAGLVEVFLQLLEGGVVAEGHFRIHVAFIAGLVDVPFQ